MPAKATTNPEPERELTVEEKIKKDYNEGAFSPLQLSYKYSVEVAQVLDAIGQSEMNEVIIGGDQIDDAGPGASINYGTRVRVPYSKN